MTPTFEFNATPTYFPLYLDKVLILTNLSWVRNPYQNEIRIRPNSKMYNGINTFVEIQGSM